MSHPKYPRVHRTDPLGDHDRIGGWCACDDETDGKVVPLSAVVIERDENGLDAAAEAMMDYDQGGGTGADHRTTEGERQWYRDILRVGLDALAAGEADTPREPWTATAEDMAPAPDQPAEKGREHQRCGWCHQEGHSLRVCVSWAKKRAAVKGEADTKETK